MNNIQDTSETISAENTSIKVFSDRGGILTSMKIDGIELLYQDMFDKTLLDTSKSVKGGIPYMFPNAGPLSEDEKEKSGFGLPQHGVGRISKWEKKNSKCGEYIQRYKLNSSDIFPFDAKVENLINLVKHQVIITHNITNLSEKNLPISTGLHPYFRVPNGKKEDIIWNFKGGDKVKENINIWSNDGTINFENPGEPIEIFIPGIGTLVIETSDDYKKFWVRSLPGKDFICIEPVMNNEGGIVNNPILVIPGETNTNFMKISLKK